MIGRTALSEAELSHIWEGLRFPPEALATRDGRRLRVVYRGRRGAGAGPDFRDAVIAAGGELRRGDVELHCRASAFRHHHHHLDHDYDGVILHIVFEDDEGEDTPLACGRRAPVVALAPWVARRSAELARWLALPPLWEEPCRSARARLGGETVVKAIAGLGERRFREKRRRFAEALASEGADHVLYAGFLTALGYSRNKEAFATLARLLPYPRLRRALASSPPASRVQTAESLLLGAAGLLPSQRTPSTGSGQSPSPLRQTQGDAASGHGPSNGSGGSTSIGSAGGRAATLPPYVVELERRWRRLSPATPSRDGAPPGWMWKVDGLRPENNPVRRIAGAAGLLARTGDGIFRHMLAAVEGRRLDPRPLIDAWTAPAGGFWYHHYHLSRPAPRPRGMLIGRGRALEIVTNVVLPLTAAWGESAGDRSLVRRALALYRRLPSPAAYGATAFLRSNLQQGRRRPGGARYQQGLLHLFRNYCTQGGCGRCPLS